MKKTEWTIKDLCDRTPKGKARLTRAGLGHVVKYNWGSEYMLTHDGKALLEQLQSEEDDRREKAVQAMQGVQVTVDAWTMHLLADLWGTGSQTKSAKERAKSAITEACGAAGVEVVS